MSGLVPAYLGGAEALATDTVVGTPEADRSEVLVPGTEELVAGELRVSILGSGLPWVTKVLLGTVSGTNFAIEATSSA